MVSVTSSISLSDIRLRNLGTDLAAAETIRVGVRLLPLLQRQVEITELILEKPVIRIEKLAGGKFNFETPPRSPKSPVRGLDRPQLFVYHHLLFPKVAIKKARRSVLSFLLLPLVLAVYGGGGGGGDASQGSGGPPIATVSSAT